MMRKLEQWIKSAEEANTVRRDFNKYQVCEYPKEPVKEKEKILDEVQKKENDCKHSLAMEIGFSISIDEFRESTCQDPGRLLDGQSNREFLRTRTDVLDGRGSVM